MNRKVNRLVFTYIIILVLLTMVLILLAFTKSARAGETIYYCKGAIPWEQGLNDFTVWVEVPCSYLPMVLR